MAFFLNYIIVQSKGLKKITEQMTNSEVLAI